MITNSRIAELKDEAYLHGDDMQVLICLIALDGEQIESFEDRFGGGGYYVTRAQRERLEGMTAEEAYTECERVIREACGCAICFPE